MSVAGSGPELARLEERCRELQIDRRVVFTGRLNSDEMRALYRDADVFLNPSRVDNTPNSILEALASEVPVVTTDVGGIPHLVKHRETALLVPPGDAQAMAEAVCEVLREPEATRSRVEAGRAISQRHSWSAVRPVLLALYQSLASRHFTAPSAQAK